MEATTFGGQKSGPSEADDLKPQTFTGSLYMAKGTRRIW